MNTSTRLKKIITWNVNSINVRLDRLVKLIQREDPDFICLQELKCTEDKFPFDKIEALGYHATIRGQKTYNGVAILSKKKPEKIFDGGIDFFPDTDARFIGIQINEWLIISVYVPNGQEVGSPKYQYKLSWLKGLCQYLKHLLKSHSNIILCGDFNIAPTNKDVHDPKIWQGRILFSDPEKNALTELLSLGFVDLFRAVHLEKEAFTWWDYRNGSFPRNQGLRIDFILGTSSLEGSVEDAYVDKNERKGTQPSDHAPVICAVRGLD
jgi:exodeoxyribonuclease-3